MAGREGTPAGGHRLSFGGPLVLRGFHHHILLRGGVTPLRVGPRRVLSGRLHPHLLASAGQPRWQSCGRAVPGGAATAGAGRVKNRAAPEAEGVLVSMERRNVLARA